MTKIRNNKCKSNTSRKKKIQARVRARKSRIVGLNRIKEASALINGGIPNQPFASEISLLMSVIKHFDISIVISFLNAYASNPNYSFSYAIDPVKKTVGFEFSPVSLSSNSLSPIINEEEKQLQPAELCTVDDVIFA